jgi:hypothetical protein
MNMNDGIEKIFKGIRIRDSSKWSVKQFIVNGEKQWWVENRERNICLAMSKKDAEQISELHNKYCVPQPLLEKSFFTNKAFKNTNCPIKVEVVRNGGVVKDIT